MYFKDWHIAASPFILKASRKYKNLRMDAMSSSSAQVLEVASILPQTQRACYVAESPALVAPEQGASAFLYT